ncbi:hypothetical protein DPMN_111059 [Dreissena polymorpha]|uniref:Uncharacterized protein n=1 Tax=Dreissena polymorpha TaxID=45954 RepID=A0A9D4QNL5_DREPO|nr:hypothetical protein DPMN_111059 [Dreissena polymorpha]
MEEAREKLVQKLNLDFEISFTNQNVIEMYNKVAGSSDCTLQDLALALDCDCERLRTQVLSVKKE